MRKPVVIFDPHHRIFKYLLQVVLEGRFSVGAWVDHLFELLEFGVDVKQVFRQFEVFVFYLFSEVSQISFEVGGFVDDLIEENNVLEFLDVLDF